MKITAKEQLGSVKITAKEKLSSVATSRVQASEPPSGQALPDVIAKNLDVLFCGINPGMQAAASGHHFMGRGNRFWRVLHHAGFTPEQMDPLNDRQLLKYGYGLTAAVARPTACAKDLSAQDFAECSTLLLEKVRKYAPKRIAFLGKVAYLNLLDQRSVAWGYQPRTFGGAEVWVLPNPSGLNRSFSFNDLVRAYRELRTLGNPTATFT